LRLPDVVQFIWQTLQIPHCNGWIIHLNLSFWIGPDDHRCYPLLDTICSEEVSQTCCIVFGLTTGIVSSGPPTLFGTIFPSFSHVAIFIRGSLDFKQPYT